MIHAILVLGNNHRSIFSLR